MTEKVEAHNETINMVNDYKKYNQNTIERVRTYDPKLRIWTFAKEAVDTNALQFKKIHITPRKKKKSFSQKLGCIDHLTPSKNKTSQIKKLKKAIGLDDPKHPSNNIKEYQELITNAEGKMIKVNKNTFCMVYYRMYQAGKTIHQISDECKRPVDSVHRELKYFNDRWNLGLKFEKLPPKQNNKTRNVLLKYIKMGITSPKKLEKETGVKYSTIMAQKANMKKLGLIKY